MGQGVTQGPEEESTILCSETDSEPTCCVTLGLSLTLPEFRRPPVWTFQGGKRLEQSSLWGGGGEMGGRLDAHHLSLPPLTAPPVSKITCVNPRTQWTLNFRRC